MIKLPVQIDPLVVEWRRDWGREETATVNSKTPAGDYTAVVVVEESGGPRNFPIAKLKEAV